MGRMTKILSVFLLILLLLPTVQVLADEEEVGDGVLTGTPQQLEYVKSYGSGSGFGAVSGSINAVYRMKLYYMRGIQQSGDQWRSPWFTIIGDEYGQIVGARDGLGYYTGSGDGSRFRSMTEDSACESISSLVDGMSADKLNGWTYFSTSLNDVNYIVYTGGSPVPVRVSGRDGAVQTRMAQIWGVSTDSFGAGVAGYDMDFFRKFNEMDIDQLNEFAYSFMPGYDGCGKVYIVIERMSGFSMDSIIGEAYSDVLDDLRGTQSSLRFLTTYTTARHVDRFFNFAVPVWKLMSEKLVNSCQGLWGNAYAKGYFWGSSDVYLQQGYEAPFGIGTISNRENQYYVLGPCKLSEEPSSAINIGVEYTGDINTSDPSKFVEAISFIDTEPDSSINSASLISNVSKWLYYDLGSCKWRNPSASGGYAEALRYDKAGVVYDSSDYSIIFAGTYSVTAPDKLSGDMVERVSLGEHSVAWSNTLVTSGKYNAGSMTEPSLVDGCASTGGIATRFARNVVPGINSVITDSSDVISKVSKSVLGGSIDTFLLALPKTGEYSIDKEFGKDLLGRTVYTAFVKANEPVGLSVEFIVKGEPVTSIGKHVTVDYDPSAGSKNITGVVQKWIKSYSTATSVSAELGSCTAFVVVPNDGSYDDLVKDAINNSDLGNPSDLVSHLSSIPGAVISRSDPGAVIGLGSTATPPTHGYIVYEVYVSAVSLDLRPLELPSYMLNRYYANVVSYTSRMELYTNPDETPVQSALEGGIACAYPGCDTTVTPVRINRDNFVNRIFYRDEASGVVPSWDDANLGRYYITMPGLIYERSLLKSGFAVSADRQYRLDYGFNLIRMIGGDKKAVSGVTHFDYATATGDTDDILRLRDYFGVVPPDGVVNAPVVRNSRSVFGTYQAPIKFTSCFDTADGLGYSIDSEIHHHNGVAGYFVCTGHVDTVSSVEWEDANNDGVIDTDELSVVTTEKTDSNDHFGCEGYNQAEISAVDITTYRLGSARQVLGFVWGGSLVNSVDYSFDNIIYKYSTDDMPIGTNAYLAGRGVKGLCGTAPDAGIVGAGSTYKFSTVRNSVQRLKFYPDVLMAYKVWSGSYPNTGYNMLAVVGEKLRTVQSSSMYLFKVSGTGDASGISGTVYSDAMQGGSGVLGLGNKVSIPAGADVTVAARMSGVTIDLYGYSLDMLNSSDDASITSVVASGADVYAIWGNSGTQAALRSEFADWCTGVLAVDNFQADFRLKAGTDVRTNFSASIGGVYCGALNVGAGGVNEALISESGVYPVTVERGVVSYSDALLDQIASDYGCSKAEASQMLSDSGIGQAISAAVEDCKDSFNKSGNTDEVNSSWVNSLGGDGNWYDEKVYVFVIRRYELTGITIKDVIAEDKIDYQLAPNASGRGENSGAGVGKNASWELTLFWNQDGGVVGSMLGSGRAYYNPEDSSTLSAAMADLTVLFDGAPVSGADFVISAYSTSDFED